jgi:surfeit locus 1 family protein
MTALTIAAVALFARLGLWQWHRAAERSAVLAQFSAGSQSITDLGGRSTEQLPRYAQVRVRGSYDNERQFLLDNISLHARPGFEVLTPLRLHDGRTLVVNRGWVPLSGTRSQLPDVHLDIREEVAVTGRLDDLPVVGISMGRVPPSKASPWPKLTSFPTMADLAASLGQPLESRQLLLNPDEAAGFVREWQVGGLTPARHLSYAVQWWGFACLALVLYGWLNWRRSPV